MLTVRLHGHLEDKYGSEFKFEASTVREVIDALQANFNDFTEEFIKDQWAYNILVDAESQELIGCILPIKTDSVIDIIPIIGGAGFLKALGLIIIGAVLIIATMGAAAFLAAPTAAGLAAGGLGGFGAGVAASLAGAFGAGIAGAIVTGVMAIGWGLVLAGVASLLAGPDGPDGGGDKSSTLSNVDNIVGQGMPIPIGYGRMMVGSFVISAGSTSSYTEISRAWTYLNTVTDTWEDKVMNIGADEDVNNGTVADDGYLVPVTSYDGGYSATQMAEIDAVNEQNLGSSNYQVINQTTSSGTTIATTIIDPVRIVGSYDGDKAINHR